MSRRPLPALLLGLLVLAAPAAARAPAGPRVAFRGWTVYAAGKRTKVRPGGTLSRCSTASELLARGTVHGAVRNQRYLETWYHDGRRTDRFTISWFGRGTYLDSWSLYSAHGFARGTWTLALTRRGRLIGRESVRLACSV